MRTVDQAVDRVLPPFFPFPFAPPFLCCWGRLDRAAHPHRPGFDYIVLALVLSLVMLGLSFLGRWTPLGTNDIAPAPEAAPLLAQTPPRSSSVYEDDAHHPAPPRAASNGPWRHADLTEKELFDHLKLYYAKRKPGFKTDGQLWRFARNVKREKARGANGFSDKLRMTYGESLDDFIAAARTITPAAVGDQNVGLEVWEKKKVGPYALHPTADGDVTFRSLMVKYDITASELIAANALGPFAGDADLAAMSGIVIPITAQNASAIDKLGLTVIDDAAKPNPELAYEDEDGQPPGRSSTVTAAGAPKPEIEFPTKTDGHKATLPGTQAVSAISVDEGTPAASAPPPVTQQQFRPEQPVSPRELPLPQPRPRPRPRPRKESPSSAVLGGGGQSQFCTNCGQKYTADAQNELGYCSGCSRRPAADSAPSSAAAVAHHGPGSFQSPASPASPPEPALDAGPMVTVQPGKIENEKIKMLQASMLPQDCPPPWSTTSDGRRELAPLLPRLPAPGQLRVFENKAPSRAFDQLPAPYIDQRSYPSRGRPPAAYPAPPRARPVSLLRWVVPTAGGDACCGAERGGRGRGWGSCHQLGINPAAIQAGCTPADFDRNCVRWFVLGC